MHLGLINGPFVPHNLISAQGSPVPLPKFQMAPRLKILIPSGSMKGTQIYYLFLSKSPSKQIPSRFPVGPLWRQMPDYREFLHIAVPQRPNEKSIPPCSPKACGMGCKYIIHRINSLQTVQFCNFMAVLLNHSTYGFQPSSSV
jgi:hypothetical protein